MWPQGDTPEIIGFFFQPGFAWSQNCEEEDCEHHVLGIQECQEVFELLDDSLTQAELGKLQLFCAQVDQGNSYFYPQYPILHKPSL